MKPALGWTQLSRDALRKAEAAVLNQEQGVRDEIGFLLLHQAYSDRFFPGTSVLQTRLRYILFVPWMYENLARQNHKGSIDTLLAAEEMRLISRLKKHYREGSGSDDGKGIIGGRSHDQGRLTSQPSSMLYWGALGRWGILKASLDGVRPGRAVVHRALRHRQHGRWIPKDDDGLPVFEEHPFFVRLPDPPKDWEKVSTPLSFNFPEDSRNEAGFVRRHMAGSCRWDGQQTLLGKLAEVLFDPRTSPNAWEPAVSDLAGQSDREALERARQAASMAAIGRAVYAALVEHARDVEDGLPTATVHRDNLQAVLQEHKSQALRLDVPGIVSDAPAIDKGILVILEETRQWLETSRPPTDLWDAYSKAEFRRKTGRARLPRTLGGRNRRTEWNSEDHPKAYPLVYRWPNVVRLLLDLGGGR